MGINRMLKNAPAYRQAGICGATQRASMSCPHKKGFENLDWAYLNAPINFSTIVTASFSGRQYFISRNLFLN
jgi:hypothetical protein